MSKKGQIMKLAKALEIIKNGRAQRYRVSYDYREGRVITSSCFPDHTRSPEVELGLSTLEEAVILASKFALVAPPEYENIYVVDESFMPVTQKLREYPG